MKTVYKTGDEVRFERKITPDDIASFYGQVVHEVYSTFALARDAEWTGRQFVLGMKEDDEEGIGTELLVNHLKPAFPGETITFVGRIEYIERNEVICSFEAKVGDRLIATGKTGQKILKKDRIKKLLESHN